MHASSMALSIGRKYLTYLLTFIKIDAVACKNDCGCGWVAKGVRLGRFFIRKQVCNRNYSGIVQMLGTGTKALGSPW